MHALEIKIRNELLSLKEEKYALFAASLIPNCQNLIGVRLPKIRKIAKKIAQNQPLEFLHNTSEIYFEEVMLKAFVIGFLNNDIKVILTEIKHFLPKINNWSVCDSFCTHLKITKNHKEKMRDFLTPYLTSTKPYEIRFALVMLINYYVQEEYLEDIFSYCNKISCKDYYVKMAIAWLICTCFTAYPTQTFLFLKENQLDDDTYHKALQKIRDSLRTDKQTKEMIKQLKRK